MIRDLHDSEFRVILTSEQIDVRHVLLANTSLAPVLGARTFLQTEFDFFCLLY